MNAWFRWKNDEDTPSHFSMDMWIAQPAITDAGLRAPATAAADITLRRLQQFKVQPSQSYSWQATRGGHVLASGQIKPDAANLLTIPQLNLTTAGTLTLSLQASP